TRTHRSEGRQLAGLAEREPAQLRQQIAEVQGRIAPRAPIEIQDHDAAILPEQLRGSAIAMQEGLPRWPRRRLPLQLEQQPREGHRLAGKQGTELRDLRPELAHHDGGRRRRVERNRGRKIGRASCREGGWMSGGAVWLRKEN